MPSPTTPPKRLPGLPPGTIIVQSESAKPLIRVFGYGPDTMEELVVEDAAALAELRGRWPVLWIDIEGLSADVIQTVGDGFDLHPLALEDVAHVGQRPKVEAYPASVFVILRHLSEVDGDVLGEQHSLFLGDGFVITFQERPGDPFDMVRKRIRDGRTRIRNSGADYLAYALVDALVDALFPVMQSIGDRLEELEDEIMERPNPSTLAAIRKRRRTLQHVRRSVWPLRDAALGLQADHLPYITPETRMYLRDVQDHVLRIIELAESSRDQVNGLMDGYVSVLSFRMNEVMSVLTLVGAIFLPLSFLSGLYGMNFNTDYPLNMPELSLPFGYLALLLVMVSVAMGMLGFFWWRGWFALMSGGRGRPPRR